MAKPSAATARPVKEFNSEITTGMSAPPMGMTIAMPKNNASDKHDDERRGGVAAGSVERQPAAQSKNDQQNEAVQNVLAGERHRLFKFSLQLQIRDDAAGKRERADERGEQHRTRDERRDAFKAVRAALKFQTRDQRRRAAAEAVEERDHLRHRGHLHRIRADRADDEADDRADGDERVIEIPALRPDIFAGRVCAATASAMNMPAAATRLPMRAVFGDASSLMPMMNKTETPMMM